MNYLRGAVSAISAPYQYYKDLNPSTLTGAIDVIVVRKPKDLPTEGPIRQLTDDETELVCSPFHVRFGKWQVLRPQDKKVDLFVNGQLVPFSMKIGDAGEAFFVFETDEAVPESLVTSPILEATEPGQSNAHAQDTGRFGARPSSPDPKNLVHQEPEFLDLNASPEGQSPKSTPSPPSHSRKSSQDGSSNEPSLLSKTAQLGKAMIGVVRETEKAEADMLKDKTVIEALQETGESMSLPALKGHEILPDVDAEHTFTPDVTYTKDMVFDTEGYHATGHGRDASDATLRSASTRLRGSSSSDSSPDRTPGPSRTPSPVADALSLLPFPTLRATSEPPPKYEDDFEGAASSRYAMSTSASRTPSSSDNRTHPPSLPTIHNSEEYTWDWGNFPQRTPVRTTFGHLPGASSDLSPRTKGKARMMSDAFSEDHSARTRAAAAGWKEADETDDGATYGLGGRLTVDRNDSTRYRVFIEGQTVEFELAIISPDSSSRKRLHAGTLGGEDEVEDGTFFDHGKVDFDRFLTEEGVVTDANLVLRWAGDKYIRRQDGSPLMDALVTWREAALEDHLSLVSSRPVSPQPLSEDESVKSDNDEAAPHRRFKRTATDSSLDLDRNGKESAPTSSSWVRWWSRSRRADTLRPDIGHTNSAPSQVAAPKSTGSVPSPEGTPIQRTVTSAYAPPISAQKAASPSAPYTPEVDIPDSSKRFAKTLRLTSDQLKSLNLRSGANSVTFSLSSTGVAACTARLFVFEYTDLVVVSDIDGTITKSDALGHVFTMIGRDWTHVGVAKLYTDICRNGYKILYLTSRAIGQADSTREYLKGIKQNDYQLPEGPVIMSPDRLMASLHREVIMRKPEVFKMACLRDIQKLFGGPTHNPFYAGFGNRITDALSYRSVSVPSSRIFTIDSTGEVKMELLELAGYKSSYIHMTDLVDQMFPPINRKWASEFTDFNYWKPPMQDFPLPDLSPPSPALSARSDTSNQSTLARLRNFSLVGSRPSSKLFALPPPATEAASQQKRDTDGNETRLRQMTSFERLSSTLASLTQSSSSTAGSPRSSSPTLTDSDLEFGEDEDGDVEKGSRRRRRRRSLTSMPGSLPGSQPGSDDEMVFEEDEEDDENRGYEGENEEEVPDEAVDEAIFEMKNVDYI